MNLLEIFHLHHRDKTDREIALLTLFELQLLNIKIEKLMTKAEFVQAVTDLKTEVDGKCRQC